MPVELKVPSVGESITEVQIGAWLKQPGEPVARDQGVVVLETDKTTMELPAPVSGVLVKVLKQSGEIAKVGEVIGHMEERAVPAQPATTTTAAKPTSEPARVMPAAARALAEKGMTAAQVTATGPGGRVLKEDVERAADAPRAAADAPSLAGDRPTPRRDAPVGPAPASAEGAGPRAHEEIVPMSMIRRRIAERLVQAQNTAALLTTFNEVDMAACMALRKQHQPGFQERHGVKLGFMSFFVKAAIEALKLFPQVNAEIRGTDVVFKHYFDIGVAVGGGRGLVVPVLRSAERLSFAAVEKAIAEFGRQAQEGSLKPEDLQGGTFTISNGGVYGSLLSTPIVNPPQSGILGLHAIQDRPVARDGQVVIRPMMYVALTYDHRLVDGREAVGFLKRIKECVEEPARMLLEV